MIINIISGSPNIDVDLIKQYKTDYNIGVDNGAYFLVANQIKLDMAVGDFDSISTDQFLTVLNNTSEVKKFDSIKNQTDTEIALDYAIKLKPKEINLFGVTGRRIDHFFSVMNLFHKTVKDNIKLNIIDKHNKIYLLKPGEYKVKKEKYKYISFFAYDSDVKKLNLTNFKYPLDNYFLSKKDTICVSNELNDGCGFVNFQSGLLLIVESND